MIIQGFHVPLTKEWIHDVLERRVKEQGIKIEDLFIITRAINQKMEGDIELETPYGKIRIFFREDLPEGKLAYILHGSKFDYPKKNNRISYGLIPEGRRVN